MRLKSLTLERTKLVLICSRVATRVTAEELQALFVHCDDQSLNLAMYDSIKSATLTRDAMDTASEISYWSSPRRNACLAAFKAEIPPDTRGFRILCPTRGTVCAKSLQSIEDNYAVLKELWVLARDVDHDVPTHTVGVQAQMQINFFGRGAWLVLCCLMATTYVLYCIAPPWCVKRPAACRNDWHRSHENEVRRGFSLVELKQTFLDRAISHPLLSGCSNTK